MFRKTSERIRVESANLANHLLAQFANHLLAHSAN